MVEYSQPPDWIRNDSHKRLLPGILFLWLLLTPSLLLASINDSTCYTNQQKSGKSSSLPCGSDARHKRTNGVCGLRGTLQKGSICQTTGGKAALTVLDFIHFQVIPISYSSLWETGTNLQRSEQDCLRLLRTARQTPRLHTSTWNRKSPARELNGSSINLPCSKR